MTWARRINTLRTNYRSAYIHEPYLANMGQIVVRRADGQTSGLLWAHRSAQKASMSHTNNSAKHGHSRQVRTQGNKLHHPKTK